MNLLPMIRPERESTLKAHDFTVVADVDKMGAC
jgi:hypothetical protein